MVDILNWLSMYGSHMFLIKECWDGWKNYELLAFIMMPSGYKKLREKENVCPS